MCPDFSSHNSPNSLIVDIKQPAKFFCATTSGKKFSNLKNLFFGQLGNRVLTAFPKGSTLGAMSDSIKGICLVCVPPKIAQIISSAVTIFMASLHPWRTRTNKSDKNKAMNQPARHFTAFVQTYHMVSIIIQNWLKDTLRKAIQNGSGPVTLGEPNLSPIRAHLALVTHFVGRESWNWLENLWRYGRTLVSHDMNLRERFVVVRAKIR